MIPVPLDALYLKRDRLVVEAMADFSIIPYFNRKRDVNPNIAHISEEIVSQPFQNQNLYLKAGIHLHWALPDALTKGIQDRDKKTVFPSVPNRWLVTRTLNGEKRQWVVESDYLYREGEGEQLGSIAYPIEIKNGNHQPFRYLGRKLPIEAWLENDPDAEYLPSLTAVGYGEPTFAAFYPNCHSVFGFYDDYSATNLEGLQYDVIGWYSDIETDYVHKFIKTKSQLTAPELIQAIQKELRWSIPDEDTQLPQQMFCYARLRFATTINTINSDEKTSVDVAVGNTGTEALSAYLGEKIDYNYQSIIEDQLEALTLSSSLEHRQLDLTAKFEEARHEKGFNAVSSGRIWTISLGSTNATTANAEDAQAQSEVTLPDNIAPKLNQLNLSQQKYDCTFDEIESMRRQLFSDWYKYMLSAYPPQGSTAQYPDIDEVKYYIQEKGIKPLKAKLNDLENYEKLLNKSLTQLQQAITQVNITQCKLKVSDILDWEKLINQLQQGTTEPIKRIKQLIPDLPSKIAGKNQGEIIDALNLIFTKNEEELVLCNRLLLIAGKNQGEIIDALNLIFTKNEEELVRCNRLLLEVSFPQLILKAPPPYTLKPIASSRYWQPTEPVILMAGEGVKPTIRHGQDGRLRDDGLLECEILQQEEDISVNSFSSIIEKIDQIENNKTGEHIGFSTWEEQPWHPFLLEWEVEVFPLQNGCNHGIYNHQYDAEFITGNYTLKENEPDFSLQYGKGAVLKAANVYSGRSILTPHAGIKLKEKIEVYLKKQLPDEAKEYYEPKLSEQEEAYQKRIQDWYKDKPNSLTNLDQQEKIQAWYEQKPCYDPSNPNLIFTNLLSDQKAKDPIYTAIRAYQNLLSLNCLSQALGGFNEALLMHKQTLQLPIADPLGFNDYQPFTDEIKEMVQQSIRSAPEPLNDFNPIRSGVMKILRLRLVDTFGQVKDLDISNIITPEQMTTPGSPYLISLPPRLVQPARINFRWLSATQGEQETNSHPATTPICGWILPNNLDNSLAVYDNQGKALGSINYINKQAQWEAAPGDNLPLAVEDIQDTHLQRLVKHIIASNNEGDSDFLDNFITALDSGLENINPENSAQHQGLALLMGRPIAVVRASLNLELEGLPAINQDWGVFWQDLRRDFRETDGFEKVKFPIRLGEYKQLNDGLLGYWLEEKESLSQVFYAPQSDAEGVIDSQIKFHDSANAWHIDLTVEEPPQTLTMLIDPRGKVHATTGILPVKALDIPPDQYQDALEKIEITFFSAPILTDYGKINLVLPDEVGYQWSWLEKEKEQWSTADKIGQTNVNAIFSGKQEIREGWLKLSLKKEPPNPNSPNP
ncbi:MAG: hypothetical protein EWV76_04890 [Microcystis novacekii Mn_MB_F_20050700_S1]|uniref:Uncharacterized protein n=1 Tax=Microcystis novacekii Mn_MB_F_20050700_S1D TaxID=2486266 RepID=A0A552IFQ5_9CHRO|nr:MAG: hypothetical protein EWV54_22040 [Microcystis novacekii Mn_MB_F_20050700_S1D]TRU90858.1 MAG: hypothetical protein EWV76_04890 [Microcystis novacekii Mn_MB_F_20050700_S1]